MKTKEQIYALHAEKVNEELGPKKANDLNNPEVEYPVVRSKFTARMIQRVRFLEPTLAKQGLKDTTDINVIMKKYLATGHIPHVNNQAPNYGFAPALELREAIELQKEANSAFMELPAEFRAKCLNDPLKFVEWLQDPENHAEATQMGFFEKREKEDQQEMDLPPAPTPPGQANAETPEAPAEGPAST